MGGCIMSLITAGSIAIYIYVNSDWGVYEYYLHIYMYRVIRCELRFSNDTFLTTFSKTLENTIIFQI